MNRASGAEEWGVCGEQLLSALEINQHPVRWIRAHDRTRAIDGMKNGMSGLEHEKVILDSSANRIRGVRPLLVALVLLGIVRFGALRLGVVPYGAVPLVAGS